MKDWLLFIKLKLLFIYLFSNRIWSAMWLNLLLCYKYQIFAKKKSNLKLEANCNRCLQKQQIFWFINFVPLHIAALSGNLELIQYIVDKTIEKNPTDILGTTLFTLLLIREHFINLTNNEGLTDQIDYSS